MSNVAITYMSGERFCRNPMIQVYLNSIARHFQGDKVVLTHDMPKDVMIDLCGRGFIVCDASPPPYGVDVFRHRWKAIFDFLCERSYFYVVLSDCKDVLWQRDVIPDLEGIADDHDQFVALCHEGVVHRQCQWNTREQTELWRSSRMANIMPPNFADWPVINGGMMAGTYSAVKDLAFLVHSCSILSRAGITDQAYFSHIYQGRRRDPSSPYVLVDPDACPYIATGNTINTQGTNYRWEDGQLLDAKGRPFALFHQWDRTQWRGDILTRYAVT